MSPEVSTPPPRAKTRAPKAAGSAGRAAAPAGSRTRRGERISVFHDAIASLRRNALMTAAATTTIVIALAVAGGGMLVSANLIHLASVLEGQVEIVAFLRDGLSAAQQRQVVEKVSAVPGVRAATVVGRAAALRRLQRIFGVAASAGDLLPSNPLPDSIEVRVTDAGRVRDVAAGLQQIPGIEEVMFGTPVIERLVAATHAVRVAGTAVAALLAAAALLIIVNTIRLTVSARRQEIEIMTLVGAPPGLIRAPFLLEGALQGACAAVLTSCLLAVGYHAVAARVASSLPFLPLLPPAAVLPLSLVIVWVLGLAVGVGGSEVGLRRYLSA